MIHLYPWQRIIDQTYSNKMFQEHKKTHILKILIFFNAFCVHIDYIITIQRTADLYMKILTNEVVV